MVARSDEFNINNDEDHVMYEGEEGDVGTGNLEGSYQHGTNQEEAHDFSTRRSNESSCCREGNKTVTSSNASCNDYEKEKTDSSSVGKEEGNMACAASDTNDDIGSQTDRRSDICGTDFENNEEARKSAQESNDGEKKEIQEHAAGCTLYVRNLPPHIRTENMKEHFTQFGEVVDCRIIMNPVTKDSRGFGFVSFATAEIADMAMEKSADIRIDGKLLRVEKARRNRPHDPTPGEYKGPTGASIKYDNCGRLKPGYVPFWHLPFVKGDHGRDSGYSRHYRRSYSRDQGRVGGYRGGAPRRLSGTYASRHYRHHDSPVNRDHYYYKGTSQNRHRSSPYNSGRASYQGVHTSLRDTGYHRSAHYPRGSSRESSLPMMKSSSKYYDTEHLHVHDDDAIKPHRFSSRYSREPSTYDYEHSRRHASRQGSNPPSQNWEKSSREPYSTHVSKDHHRRPVPTPSSVHRSVANDSYGFPPPSVETVSPSKSYYATGSSLHAPNRSSVVYESRHNSRSAAPSCVDHEYYESSNPVGNADRYGIGSYSHGNSSRLRSRGVSGEQFSHHDTTVPYGTTRGTSVSRRRLSPSPTPNASNRYAPHTRNAPSTLMRGVPSNEQGGNSLYVSNERMQRHISTARSRSPLDVRGAPAPSSFVCHH